MGENNEEKCGIESIDDGMPTGPDVELLISRFGVPQPGDSVGYDEVVDTLRLNMRKPYDANRFKTVTNAWRRRLLKEHNIVIACQGRAFVSLDDERKWKERVVWHGKKAKNQARYGAEVSRATDRNNLSEEAKRGLDFCDRCNASIIGMARLYPKSLRGEAAQVLGIANG